MDLSANSKSFHDFKSIRKQAWCLMIFKYFCISFYGDFDKVTGRASLDAIRHVHSARLLE